MNPAREEMHIQALITALQRRVAGGDGWTETVDLQELFFRYTLDTTTDFLFGQSINTQFDQSADSSFSRAFDRTQDGIALGARLGSLFWLAHMPAFCRAVKTTHAFVEGYIRDAIRDRRQEELAAEKTPEAAGEDGPQEELRQDKKYRPLLANLVRATQDPIELRDQLLSVLLAGRDTTALTLSWLFLILADARHAAVFRRLRAAVLESFGRQAGELSLDRIRSCHYLQWYINECLRLYPIIPINTRVVQADTRLPTGGGPNGRDGVYLRKGSEVIFSVHLMHRCKEIWGFDADDFRPERWENRLPGWDYLPFGGGPRTCLG